MSDLTPALTEDMVEKAAHSLAAREGYDWDDVSQHWQRIYRDRAEDALSAALAGRVVVEPPTRQQVWDAIAPERVYSTDTVIDALVDAGFLRLAAEGGEPHGE